MIVPGLHGEEVFLKQDNQTACSQTLRLTFCGFFKAVVNSIQASVNPAAYAVFTMDVSTPLVPRSVSTAQPFVLSRAWTLPGGRVAL